MSVAAPQELLTGKENSVSPFRHGVSLLKDNFKRAREKATLFVTKRTPTPRELVFALTLGGITALAFLPSYVNGDEEVHKYSEGYTPLVAETLARSAGIRQKRIYEQAIDDAFRGKLVLTREEDLGPLDVETFVAKRQLDGHNPPNPRWEYSFNRPLQPENSASLITTLYFDSLVPLQAPVHDLEYFRNVKITGNISPIVGNPDSNEDLLRSLNSILGDAELYNFTIGAVGPSRDSTPAAIARLVINGELVSRATLSQTGELVVDSSQQKIPLTKQTRP